MSIFVSSQDYFLSASECEKIECVICGHEYKMLCKKDKVEQAKDIIERIKPLIIKMAAKNQVLSFDKILFMVLLDLMAKEKDFKIEPKVEQVKDESDLNIKLKNEKESLTNDFIEILKYIQTALNE